MSLREDCYRAFARPHPPDAVVERMAAGMPYGDAWEDAHVDLVLEAVAEWCMGQAEDCGGERAAAFTSVAHACRGDLP